MFIDTPGAPSTVSALPRKQAIKAPPYFLETEEISP